MANNGQSAERIAGRANGVMFFAGFGSLWLLLGFSAMHELNWLTGALVVGVLLALFLPALCLHRRAEAARAAGPVSEREAAEQRRVRQTFNRVNGAQYIAIPLVIAGMNLLRRPEWIGSGIGIVVGLHLFPLARLFRSPTHHVTGAALVSYAVFSMAVLPRAEVPAAGALGNAAILLVSAAYTLLKSRAALNTRAPMQLA